MKGRFVLMIAALAGCLSLAHAVEPVRWNNESARSAAASVQSQPLVRNLFTLTVAGSTGEVLDLLEYTRQRQDWPEPARDVAIHAYTNRLRELPASAVPGEIMVYLKAYEPVTLVPHLDHPSNLVPLLNIGAAATGVENSWRRQEATLEGRALINSNPRALVDVYQLESHAATRLGYLNALAQSDTDQANQVALHALERLAKNKELTRLAGRAALQAGNEAAFERVLLLGQGDAMAHLMRDSGKVFSSTRYVGLLQSALASPQLEVGALAIAELGTLMQSEPMAASLLMSRLDDPALGAGAALTLAQHGSDETRKELSKLAQKGDGLTSSRARSALAMMQDRQPGESHE